MAGKICHVPKFFAHILQLSLSAETLATKKYLSILYLGIALSQNHRYNDQQVL